MRARGRAVVMSMLLLCCATAPVGGDDATKRAVLDQDGRAELSGIATTAAFGPQSGHLRVHTPIRLGADQPAASIASPSRLHRAGAIEPAATRRGVDREKLLALLILMLKQDRGAR